MRAGKPQVSSVLMVQNFLRFSYEGWQTSSLLYVGGSELPKILLDPG